jgi:hypothetical protein
MVNEQKLMKVLEYSDSQTAWEHLNEYFLNNQEEILERGGARYGPQLVSYDVMIHIRKAWVDPKFDFGNTFGYRKQKWTSLVNNYINMNYLDILKAEVLEKVTKKNQSYNLSMRFDNSHGSGKNCLLSLTVSKRIGLEHPIFIFNLRSSEITKRLLWDLLLVQRIAEYIYGNKEHISIKLFCGNMYQNTESFIMYNNHKKIKDVLIPMGTKTNGKPKYSLWQERATQILEEFKNVDPKTVKFKVHLRSVNQIQRCKNGHPLSGNRPLLAKECIIGESFKVPYPEDCITSAERKKFKRGHLRKLKRDEDRQKSK